MIRKGKPMASIADGIDRLEELSGEMFRGQGAVVTAIISEHLLPVMAVADAMREAAARIDTDGTPSQVGPSAGDLRAWADMLRPVPDHMTLNSND